MRCNQMKPHSSFNFRIHSCIVPQSACWVLLVVVLLTGCREHSAQKNPDTGGRFSSFRYLVQTLYFLHAGATNQQLCIDIEGFINKEIARASSEVKFSELSHQDQIILRVVKGYWETFPPSHREYPETEHDWKVAQAFLKGAEAIKPVPLSQVSSNRAWQAAERLVVGTGGVFPRMIVLQCSDRVTGMSITNCAVAVDGPVRFVSLYPNDSDPTKLDCRVVLIGQPSASTEPMLKSLGVTNLDSYLTVQIRVQADHYVPETVRIPAIDLTESNVVQRAVRLSPK